MAPFLLIAPKHSLKCKEIFTPSPLYTPDSLLHFLWMSHVYYRYLLLHLRRIFAHEKYFCLNIGANPFKHPNKKEKPTQRA